MTRPLSPFKLQFSNPQGFWVRVASNRRGYVLLAGLARTSEARKA